MPFRIIVDIIIFLSVILLPWWIGLIFALVALFYFTSYYEFLVVGFIIDSLYSTPINYFYGFNFVVTLGCIIIFLISFPLKRRLTFYTAE